MAPVPRPRDLNLGPLLAPSLALMLVMGACGAPGARGPDVDGDPNGAVVSGARDRTRGGAPPGAERGPGLTGAGVRQAAPAAPEPRVVAWRPLDAATAAPLLAALPPARPPSPSRPPSPAPSPTPSSPLAAAFPAPPPAPAPPSGPPAVHLSPEGEVAHADLVSLTFDRPMRVTPETAATLATLSPAVPGTWSWLGDRTVLFTPRAPTLPRATVFELSARPGAVAADGGVLQRSKTATFSTPAPYVVRVLPEGDAMLRRKTPLLLVFDQPVEPAAVAPLVHLAVAGQARGLRLAAASELAPFPDLAAAWADAPGRAVALLPDLALPAGAVATLSVDPGVPAREGPRVAPRAQVFTLRTAAPLAVAHARCGFGDPCRPGEPWTLELSAPLDAGAFDPRLVTVAPPLPGVVVTAAERWITVRGASRGRTSYTVTLGAGLRDRFGEPLAAPATATFAVGPAEPSLDAPGGALVTLAPGAPAVLPITTVNLAAVRVTVRRVAPALWPAWLEFIREAPRAPIPLEPPGELLEDRVIALAAAPDLPLTTAIDLAPALPDGVGQLVVSVTPTTAEPAWYQRLAVHRWVAATRLGVTAWADGERVVAWVSDLADGSPVAGAEVVGWGADPVRTGADGVATLPLAALDADARAFLVVRRGANVALVPDGDTGLGGPSPWRRAAAGERVRWLVFDGGGAATAGASVAVLGWVREWPSASAGAALALPDPAVGPWVVAWEARDVRGRRLDGGEVALDAGAFAFDVAVPARTVAGEGVLALVLSAGAVEVARHERPLAVANGASNGATPGDGSPPGPGGVAIPAVPAAAERSSGAAPRVAPRAALQLVGPSGGELALGTPCTVRVQAPFAEGSGVAVVARDGVLDVRAFTVTRGAGAIALTATEAWRPGVVVDAVAVARGGQGARVHAAGRLGLAVATRDRALTVTMTPPAALAPGAEGAWEVTVRGALGEPVAGAEVALLAAPTGGAAVVAADPYAWFWGGREAGVVREDGFARVLPSARGEVRAVTVASGAGAAPEAAGVGALVGRGWTDAGGRATVRGVAASAGADAVVAVAAAGADRFGRSETYVAPQESWRVDAMWPSHMVTGDRVEVRFAVHNQGRTARTVRLAARGDGLALPAGDAGAVDVAPGEVVAVALPVVAGPAGEARGVWVAEAAGERRGGAAVVTVAAAGVPQRRAADGVVPLVRRRGRVELAVAARDGASRVGLILAASRAVLLAPAIAALREGRDGGAERLASRVLAWAALLGHEGWLEAVGLGERAAVVAQIRSDLEALRALQDDHGGVGAWRRGEDVRPWLVVHVAHALARARLAGVAPPGELLAGVRRYLAGIERRLGASDGAAARAAVLAHALYVRALLRDRDPERALALVAEAGPDGPGREAAAWLVAALEGRAGRRGPRAAAKAQLAGWFAGQRRGAEGRAGDLARLTYASPAREAAVVLDAQVTAGAKDDALEAGVAALLGRRVDGAFGGPVADAWAVLALARAFAALERERVDLTVSAQVGGAPAVEGRLRGRGAALVVPEVGATPGAPLVVAVAAKGQGTLRWALSEAWLAPLGAQTQGFAVSRRYEGVDDPEAVVRAPDGSWRLRAGARVRVVVTVAAAEAYAHVAISDPLGAGFEAEAPCRAGAADCAMQQDAFGIGARALSYEVRPRFRGRIMVPGSQVRSTVAAGAWGQGAPDRVVIE